ncbi:MAG TPA: capsule assembly Wzi family protein [Longimicrobium sp.]|nr:capsule assembly Wzi family protein [Longimicrobium sp.]
MLQRPFGPALGAALLAASLACAPAAAQQAPPRDLHAALGAGSEVETYLRTLQLVGAVPLHPWSVRSLSPRQARELAPAGAHPWSRVYRPAERAARVAAVPAGVSAAYNSAFPYGMNDGPVWSGRGLTASASAGVALRAGALSVQVAPVAFWAENRAFELMPTGGDGRLAFADPLTPDRIDLPQRFGDGAYRRVDPGESFARVDVGRVAAGFSTAAQQWGPAVHQPIVLGPNAGGFPHVFLGTAAPLDVYVGSLSGRIVWGELSQSPWSVVEGHGSRRFVTAAVAAFTPRGIPGLEIGGVRLFQGAWPRGGLGVRDFAQLFQAFEKADLPESDSGQGANYSPDNQLASVFVRWVLPSAGLEVYGEFGREDHSWDLLDFYLEPDHQSAYSLGVRKAWRAGGGVWLARGELLNSQPSHLLEARKQPPFYQHNGTRQGHTHHGQLLGAPFGHGGGGSVVGVDRYHPGGRLSLEWVRGRVAQDWEYDSAGVAAARATDVVHALSLDGLLLRRRVDVTWGASAVFNLNRHFARDELNLNARLGMRFPL